MSERLARLHGAHDRRVDLILAILDDAFGGRLVLDLRLAHLDGVDLDAEERRLRNATRETRVVRSLGEIPHTMSAQMYTWVRMRLTLKLAS